MLMTHTTKELATSFPPDVEKCERNIIMQNSTNTQPIAIVLRNKNYVCKDVPGNGNCLYNSLCETDFFREYSPGDLRKQFITRLKRAANHDKNLREQWKQFDKDNDFTKYCDKHSVNGKWGGSCEACLISYLFQVNIRFAICESQSNRFTINDTTVGWLCSHTMIAREEATNWSTITVLFHKINEPQRASIDTERNHFLLLVATDDGEESAPTFSTEDVIELSTDEESYVSAKNKFVPGTRNKRKERNRQRMMNRRNIISHNSRIAERVKDVKNLPANNEAIETACSQTIPNEKNASKKTYRSRLMKEKYYWTHLYHHLKVAKKIRSQREFLLSKMSGTLSVKDTSIFSRWYKKYLNGELDDTRIEAKRATKSELHIIDQKLLSYIIAMRKKSGNNGKGSNLTWTDLQKAALQALQQLSEEDREKIGCFNASIGYVSNFLKRYVMLLEE